MPVSLPEPKSIFVLRAMHEHIPSDSNLRYPWRPLVLDAILELDPECRLAKIISAERAISIRLIEGSADPNEQLEIQYALCALKVLQHMA